MGHLAGPRIGWENERLASFILSRIAFVSSPLSIADDVGSDFLCNLFRIIGNGPTEQLIPRIAFAIQIKSNHRNFGLTEKIPYLLQLETAFFVGVIDQKKLKLTIYSGEYLPILFAQEGEPRALRVELVRKVEGLDYYQAYGRKGSGQFRVFFPRVLSLSASASRNTRVADGDRLHDRCRIIQRNIFSRRREEHIYEIPGSAKPIIMAGGGSALHFRDNLYMRLAEAFANLAYLAEHEPRKFRADELAIYDAFYKDLTTRAKDSLPLYLKRWRKKSLERIGKATPSVSARGGRTS